MALDWWLDCIKVKRTKGIAASQDAYEKAEARVQWLKALDSGGDAGGGFTLVCYADDVVCDCGRAHR